MAKKTLKAQDPRSEAAIHRLIRGWEPENFFTEFSEDDKDRKITIRNERDKVLAVIDLRALVRKRKPLKGIKKEFAKIVRGAK